MDVSKNFLSVSVVFRASSSPFSDFFAVPFVRGSSLVLFRCSGSLLLPPSMLPPLGMFHLLSVSKFVVYLHVELFIFRRLSSLVPAVDFLLEFDKIVWIVSLRRRLTEWLSRYMFPRSIFDVSYFYLVSSFRCRLLWLLLYSGMLFGLALSPERLQLLDIAAWRYCTVPRQCIVMSLIHHRRTRLNVLTMALRIKRT